jgi:hypothetical protein
MNVALSHFISAIYVASRSLVWVPVGSKTHKQPTHESLQKSHDGNLTSAFQRA